MVRFVLIKFIKNECHANTGSIVLSAEQKLVRFVLIKFIKNECHANTGSIVLSAEQKLVRFVLIKFIKKRMPCKYRVDLYNLIESWWSDDSQHPYPFVGGYTINQKMKEIQDEQNAREQE